MIKLCSFSPVLLLPFCLYINIHTTMMWRLKEPAAYEQTFVFGGQRANQANEC